MPRQLELSIPRRVAFVVLPGFSLTELSLAIAPLNVANSLSPTPLYRPLLYALSEHRIASLEGPRVVPDHTTATPGHPPHLVMVCAPATDWRHEKAISWLRQQAERKIPLGGITNGGWLLAEAGLLADHRHVLPSAQTQCDGAHMTVRYEIDRDRMTCNSSVAGLEMMVQLVALEHGADTAYQVRQRLVQDGLHPALSERDALTKEHLAQHAPRLLAVLRLMEANRETPLSPAALSQRIGLSLRHLERLFQEHCHCSPRQYYLRVRLDHPRALLQDTDLSVREISRAIGLDSASYFARRFRERFGCTPTQTRK